MVLALLVLALLFRALFVNLLLLGQNILAYHFKEQITDDHLQASFAITLLVSEVCDNQSEVYCGYLAVSLLLPKIAYPGHHFKEEIADNEIKKSSLLATNDLTLVVGDIHTNLNCG